MITRKKQHDMQVHLLDPKCTPTRATKHSAGLDLYCRPDTENPAYDPQRKAYIVTPGMVAKIPLGLIVSPPEYCQFNTVGCLYLRSGVSSKTGVGDLYEGADMPNNVGVIDADYRGEIMGLIRNLGTKDIVIDEYSRIFQLVIYAMPFFDLDMVESIDELGRTFRGSGGFGSSDNPDKNLDPNDPMYLAGFK